MKTIKTLSLIFASIVVLGLTSCSNDDDNNVEPVNEEEVITTLIVTFTSDGNPTVVMTFDDPSGDGSSEPVVTVTNPFVSGATYQGTVEVLNRTESPIEDITEEVEEEDTEHQFFFIAGGGLDVTTQYENFDGNGNPLGTRISLVAGAASSGIYTVILRHDLNKPNDGTLADAGGETDISATFDATVQ